MLAAATERTMTAIAAPRRESIDDFPRQGSLKRAAQDALQAPAAKCPRSVKPSSINDILRQYPRERLYVEPLHWTGRHLELLGCVFSPGDRPTEKRRAADRTKVATSQLLPQSVAVAAKCLGPRNSTEIKAGAMWDILGDHGFHKLSGRYVSFAFNERRFCYLSTDGTYATSTTAQAALAFLNLDAIAKRRDNSIERSPCNRVNPPMARARRKKLALIQPKDVTQDPYIAAVLIALAQGQWRPNTMAQEGPERPIPISPDLEPKRPPLDSSSFKVFVLATAAHRLYLYTADIPLAFLERLNRFSQQLHVEVVPLCYKQIPLHKLSKTLENIAESKTELFGMNSGLQAPC